MGIMVIDGYTKGKKRKNTCTNRLYEIISDHLNGQHSKFEVFSSLENLESEILTKFASNKFFSYKILSMHEEYHLIINTFPLLITYVH